MKRALARLAPGAVLVLAAAALAHVPALRPFLWLLLPVYPYAVFGGGLLLAWRFGRSRLVLALLVLGLADRALLYVGAAAGPGRAVFGVVAVLVPLNLVILSWTSERGLLSPRGRWKLLLLLAQVLLVALLGLGQMGPAGGWLEDALGDALLPGGLPRAALAAFGLALLLGGIRFACHPTAIEGGSLWAVVAAFLGVSAAPGGALSTTYLAAGGLVLVVSLIEASHGMAYVDELTGLPGRRALNGALGRLGERFAIAMVDIDHFKRFNDEHGHDVGDQLLRMVGARLAGVGGGGRPFRYGGEEFALIFPGKPAAAALPHLEALRATLEASSFTVRARRRPSRKPAKPRPGAGRKRVVVTVSIGVAEAGPRRAAPEKVLEAADQALYRAKRAGRNRVAT